ncbi:hypothetical protein Sango_2247400 [Sesamum angolense]|uniref:Uncharacterized protein n=1 Tax=Sesamum angolense TaxID=2727404 RepID=A0AAE2BKX3_9LAMI|nr:hypothetical protein Sango_2247400 [Sesamum angolense]
MSLFTDMSLNVPSDGVADPMPTVINGNGLGGITADHSAQQLNKGPNLKQALEKDARFVEKEREMEKIASVPGSRQLNLKKSFKRGLRSLLTACSDEEFRKAFPSFTAAEQERLHRLFIQVITSLHEDIEEEFESIFLETQAGTALNNVEELVEEHNLDPLLSQKSNVGETAQNLSEAKKNELKHLMGLLEKWTRSVRYMEYRAADLLIEEQKRKIKARLELLKKEKQDFSGAANLVDEIGSNFLATGKAQKAGNNLVI